MDKLNLPSMGEQDWFTKLVQSLSTLDKRYVDDGFTRDYVLMDGLSKPSNSQGVFGINHFKIGDLNIVIGWGDLTFNLKQYQEGHVQLPYQGADFRCIVGDVYSWDGFMKVNSISGGRIAFTPNADVNGTYTAHFILMWSDN